MGRGLRVDESDAEFLVRLDQLGEPALVPTAEWAWPRLCAAPAQGSPIGRVRIRGYARPMRTAFVTTPPGITEELIARRQALGQDRRDEVWEGVYHVAPEAGNRHQQLLAQLVISLHPRAARAGLLLGVPINVGRPMDFRVPDLGFVRREEDPVWNPTAAVVVEIVSPRDESRLKFDFYHRVGVEEFLIVDPGPRTVECFARGPEGFVPVDGSALLGITSAELAATLDWPA